MAITMRATKGLLSAFGAGGALIAAAVCALVILSAMVAEHGWPGVAAPLRSSQLVAGGAQQTAPTGAAPAVPTVRVNVGASPASSRAGARRPGARQRASQLPVVAAQGQRSRTGLTATPVAATHPKAAGGGRRPTGAGQSGQPTHTSGSASPGSTPLASTVQSSSGAAGNAVAPVNPAAGNAVTQAGNSAAGAVDQTVTAVGHVLPGR